MNCPCLYGPEIYYQKAMILSSMLKRPAWLGIVDILYLVLYTSLTVFAHGRCIHMMLFQLWPDPHPVQGVCKCGRYLASSMASSCSERGSSEGLVCSLQSVRFFLTPSECTPLTRHEMLFHRRSDDLLPVLGMCIQYLSGKVNAHSSF